MIILDVSMEKKSKCQLCTIDECKYVRNNLYEYCKCINHIAGHEDAMWYLCNVSEYIKNSIVRRVVINGKIPKECIARGKVSVELINYGLAAIISYRNAIVHASNSLDEVRSYSVLRKELRVGSAFKTGKELPDDIAELVGPMYCESFINKLSIRYNHSFNRIMTEIFKDTDIPSVLINYCRNNVPHMKCDLSDDEFLNKFGAEILVYRNVFEAQIRDGDMDIFCKG